MCLFDATRRWPEEEEEGAGRSSGSGEAGTSNAAATTPVFLREFSLGRQETKGVREKQTQGGHGPGRGEGGFVNLVLKQWRS